MGGYKFTPEEYAEKQACIADIVRHIAQYGPSNWRTLREKYPEVKERKFFRWVKEAQETNGVPKAMVRAAQVAKRITNENLPAPVPPEYVARNGAAAERKIDFLSQVNVIWDDLMFLRDQSLKKDGEGKVVGIKQFPHFITSIRQRLDTLETVLKIKAEVWDYNRMEDFYNEIIAIIVEEVAPHPETQRIILHRLQKLNERRGATFTSN